MKKRKDGLYASQVYLGTENGKRKYKTVYGKTQKEVKEKVAELKLKLGKGIDIAAAEDNFSSWAKRLIEDKTLEGVGHSHLNNLKNFSKHLEPIALLPLSKITIADIQSIINRLAIWHEGKRPLSKKTLIGIKQTAGQVFKLAISSRATEYNPAEYVKIPKTAIQVQRTAIPEYQQGWINETPHRAQRAAMILLYSGLRKGELLALTWADINFDRETIVVTKALEYVGNRARIKAPKTDAGTRTVDIPTDLVLFLRGEREKDNYINVIHTKDGKRLSKSAWNSLWNSYMKDLNIKYGHGGHISKYTPGGTKMMIEPFTAHQLRHTFCTLLHAAGYDLVEAKNQMGHRSIQTTANIYTHLDKVTGGKSKGKLSKYLRKYSASEEVAEKA